MRQRIKRSARRKQEDRRRETQASILAASIQLLIEFGYAGFSASRVAAQAGVSRGAQEHYFPTKNKLIAATTQQAMIEAVAHARSLAVRASHSSDPIDKFLLDSSHFFFSPIYRALMEIMVAARSDRPLSRLCYPIVNTARIELNSIWTDTLETAGYSRDRALRFVELTHYLLRGIFLVDTWLPYEIDRRSAVETWRQLAPIALGDRPRKKATKTKSKG